MRITDLNQLPAHMRAQVERQLADQANPPAPIPAAAPPAEKPRKYRNQVVIVDGERFDSLLEYDCFRWLESRRASGEVSWFLRQVPFRLEGNVTYRADFLAVLGAGVEVWDAKGTDTRQSINKRKQVRDRYGVDVMLWTRAERAASGDWAARRARVNNELWLAADAAAGEAR